MSITPAELRTVRFPLVRRGYDVDAVDRAFGRVADALEELVRERTELRALLAERAAPAPTATPPDALLTLLGDVRAVRSLVHALYAERLAADD